MLTFICLFVIFNYGSAYLVPDHRDDQVYEIKPQTLTSWGTSGRKEYCEPGLYAYGFKLNAGHTDEDDEDDETGVNAIVLYCNGTNGQNTKIASKYKHWGTWQDKVACPGNSFLNGAAIKSQEKQGLFKDDTAVNNVRFSCTDGSEIEGVGDRFGQWGPQESCPPNSAICGIKTQVEDWQGNSGWFADDTTLNNATFYCCSF